MTSINMNPKPAKSPEAAPSVSPAKGPSYVQMVAALRGQIESGELQPGDRLPSLNEMQFQFGASRMTVHKVQLLLEKDGLVRREQGRGTFVSLAPERRAGVLALMSAGTQGEITPYWAHLVSGAREAAAAAGRQLLLLNSQETPSIGWEKVDGVLLADDYPHDNLPPEMAAVTMMHPRGDTSCVVADDKKAMRAATQHLLALGHRRIACIMEIKGSLSLRRLSGYRQALQTADIEPQDLWLRPFESWTEEIARFEDKAHRSMEVWLQQGFRETGCTAILAHNDEAAVGIIEALHQHGLRVPDDVSVVGYDGTEVSDFHRPRLTTVQLPLRDIGFQAVDLLLKNLEQTSPRARNIVLSARLKIGATTAKPR